MKPLEILYLIIGIGIVVHGSIDHGLTPTELGAALFFLGLVPVTRADRKDVDNNRNSLRQAVLKWLSR